MDTFGGRLRIAMDAREMTAGDLIRAKVLSKAGVYFLLDGTTTRDKVRDSTIAKLCGVLKISRAWLVDGKGDMEAVTPDDDWADVVGYSQAVGLGTSGPEAQEYAETHKLHFRRESLRRKHLNPKDLSVMYGKGDSMEPRIQSGDAIMFDTTDTAPKNGGVYVILTDGAAADEYNVKRCKIGRDKRVMFVADNPDGDHDWKEPRWKDDPASPIKIIGRVRWVGGWVK